MRNRLSLAPGLVIWLVGLSIGSVVNRLEVGSPGPSAQVVAGMPGYTMLAADFHVHSFPGDGALLPWDVASEARRRRVDVIALTNHNQLLEWRLARVASPWMPKDVIVLPGEEVTSPGFHLAAIGIQSPVRWARSAREVIDAVHARGGVAIAAHPGKGYAGAYDAEALSKLDGVETAHPMGEIDERRRREVEAFYARARAAHPSIAAIGSSDFHREAPIGLGRTYVFVTERTEAGVLDAVRAGRTAACDAMALVTGEEPWVSLARASCEATMQRVRSTPSRSRAR